MFAIEAKQNKKAKKVKKVSPDKSSGKKSKVPLKITANDYCSEEENDNESSYHSKSAPESENESVESQSEGKVTRKIDAGLMYYAFANIIERYKVVK